MLHLAIFVTQRCNEVCEYCDIPTITSPKDVNLDCYLKYIDIAQDYHYHIDLTGGEIGLLDETTLDTIFRKLKRPAKVNTNGLFVERGYYDKYKDKISMLWYHIVREGIRELQDEKVKYIIVRHKENEQEVQHLLNRYKHLDTTVNNYGLKDKSKKHLMLDLKYRRSELGCYINTKMIDTVDEELLYCCESYTQSPRCSIDKIDKFLERSTAPEFDLCNSCTKMIKWKGTNIKHRVLYGKI